MFSFIVRRLLQALFLSVAAAVITFCLIHLAPGDPIVALAGEDGDAGYYQMMRERFGLDKPLSQQVWIYFGRVFRGDLGFSYRYNQPAITVILSKLPVTLLLILPSLAIATGVGIALGLLSASRPHGLTDTTINIGVIMVDAVPGFWLAQLLLLGFAYYGEWLPVQGMTNARERYEGWQYVTDVLKHMVLPVTALSLQYLTPIARVTRASLLEVLPLDYIRTATSKGLAYRRVLTKHALRNAVLPVLTVIGAQLGFMVAGAVLIETVFAWPGLGRILLSAMLNRDYAIITSMFLLLSLTIVIMNLVVDLCYALFDPRIRYG